MSFSLIARLILSIPQLTKLVCEIAEQIEFQARLRIYNRNARSIDRWVCDCETEQTPDTDGTR